MVQIIAGKKGKGKTKYLLQNLYVYYLFYAFIWFAHITKYLL